MTGTHIFKTWPRISDSVSQSKFVEVGEISGPIVDTEFSNCSFEAIGLRATVSDCEELRQKVIDIAREYGFNRRLSFDQDCPQDKGTAFEEFDYRMNSLVFETMKISAREAAERSMWNWVTLSLLPDVTHWRWRFVRPTKAWNRERWIATDLTRHTWARYWWRSYRFSQGTTDIRQLTETDLVQLFERKDTLAADLRLLSCMTESYLKVLAEEPSLSRRSLVSEASKRALRYMAFTEPLLLDDSQLRNWTDRVFRETAQALISDCF